MNKDELGIRMKENYELRARMLLPRRTYTIIRLDGKAFHSYTRGLDKPFDYALIEDMGRTMVFLCENISGCVLGYQQSDEISLLLTDFATNQTEAWFGGNAQKIVSISASLCTDAFNRYREERDSEYEVKRGYFDSRVFTIPDPTEVANYFIWRQKDATRNSVSMAAQANFPHKALHTKSSAQMQEMLFQEHGINWNDYPIAAKRGQVALRVRQEGPVEYTDKRTGELVQVHGVQRSRWELIETPIFTQSDWLKETIPVYE